MTKLKQIRLGDLAVIISGYAFKSEIFTDAGVPVIKIANIKNGATLFEEGKTAYLPAVLAQAVKERFWVRRGDILISLTGSHLTHPNSVVGRVAQYKESFPSLLNQRAGKVWIKDKDELSNAYLYYFLLTDSVRQEIALLAHGAANQANVSPKDIEKLKFNIPQLGAQQKIAAILSAYDDLIENNKRRIALLEKMAEEIYREWFVRMRFPGHEKATFVKGVPEGWEVADFGSIANFTMGQSPKSEYYNETGEGLPFNQGVGTYGDRFPQKVKYCSADGRRAKKGDILFSVRAPVGRINIADCEMIIGRGLAAINHKHGFTSYLFYLLKVAFASEDIIGNGAIFNSVGKGELAKFKIFQPDETLIRRFNEIAAKIDHEIELLIRSVDNLKSTRDLLLPRLISGKLSVEDLDIQFPPSMQDEAAPAAEAKQGELFHA